MLEAIAELYPDADLVTPWTNAPERFPGRNVRELWLARSPIRGRKAAAVPALAAAWRTAVPRDKRYDWVLASSHLFSHHIRPRGLSADAPKLVYAYTPARYIWTPSMDDRGTGLVARAGSFPLRPLDRRRAREAAAVAGISEFVRRRIQETWQVDAAVIYPPVETSRLRSVADWRDELTGTELGIVDALPEQFILGASRFIPYKRLDLVISAAEEVGLPVVLAGGGPEAERLRAQADGARVPVTFIENPSNSLLYALYQAAAVFVFPPVEDFGIMPVEAIALGTPVVASAFGGSAETVQEKVSGIHFSEPTPASISRAIDEALGIPAAAIRDASDRFSRETFDLKFREWLDLSVAGSVIRS